MGVVKAFDEGQQGAWSPASTSTPRAQLSNVTHNIYNPLTRKSVKSARRGADLRAVAAVAVAPRRLRPARDADNIRRHQHI
eukprot:6181211-Pleurochrysis_carterae.AAC.2